MEIIVGNKRLYYDVDADQRVYWLQVHANGKVQRRRVHDEQLIATIRKAANDAN